MLGNLVAQTTDSHHAELDVLRPGRSRTVWWVWSSTGQS